MTEEALWGRHTFTQDIEGSNRVEVWTAEDGTQTVVKVYDSLGELIVEERFDLNQYEALNTYVQSFFVAETAIDVEEPPETDERWTEAINFDWDTSGLED